MFCESSKTSRYKPKGYEGVVASIVNTAGCAGFAASSKITKHMTGKVRCWTLNVAFTKVPKDGLTTYKMNISVKRIGEITSISMWLLYEGGRACPPTDNAITYQKPWFLVFDVWLLGYLSGFH